MTPQEKFDLLSDIRRITQAHLNEIFRLEAEIKRLDMVALGVVHGRVNKDLVRRLLPPGELAMPTFALPPQDRNGETTIVDAIRIVLPELPEFFRLRDVRSLVKRRFNHVNVRGDSFAGCWKYVRERDRSIVRLNNHHSYQKCAKLS
jgi:hypothetical protein